MTSFAKINHSKKHILILNKLPRSILMQSEQRTDQPLGVNLDIILKNINSDVVSLSTQFSLKEGDALLWSSFPRAVKNMVGNILYPVLKIYKTENPGISTTFISNSFDFKLIRMHNKIKITQDEMLGYEFDDLNCNYTVEISPRGKHKKVFGFK